MQTALMNPAIAGKDQAVNTLLQYDEPQKAKRPARWREFLIRMHVKIRLIRLALRAYESVSKAGDVLVRFLRFKNLVAGRSGKRKIVVKNGKAWFGPYIPPFPSAAFDRFILTEYNRYAPHALPVNTFQQVNFAITTHCPMRCEHCFEWDNLNKPETFSLQELKELTGKMQQQGLGQISLSGGEPMVRFEDMLELIRSGNRDTQWWVFTSGFNLTNEKARQLKKAGAAGVLISIDHFDPALHNLFRGHKHAFFHASRAARAAADAGLLVGVSVCVTRPNANRTFLLQHAKMAASFGADFIQWLEPRAEGHFRNSDVLLHPGQIAEMESLFLELNHNPAFRNYPSIIYHGYHQRRAGCPSGGRFSFYIDAAGIAHSCPFCHSHDFHIWDWLSRPPEERVGVTPCKFFASAT